MHGYFQRKQTKSIQNIEVWVENFKKRKSQIYHFQTNQYGNLYRIAIHLVTWINEIWIIFKGKSVCILFFINKKTHQTSVFYIYKSERTMRTQVIKLFLTIASHMCSLALDMGSRIVMVKQIFC